MRIAFYNVTATYLTGGLETYCWDIEAHVLDLRW